MVTCCPSAICGPGPPFGAGSRWCRSSRRFSRHTRRLAAIRPRPAGSARQWRPARKETRWAVSCDELFWRGGYLDSTFGLLMRGCVVLLDLCEYIAWTRGHPLQCSTRDLSRSSILVLLGRTTTPTLSRPNCSGVVARFSTRRPRAGGGAELGRLARFGERSQGAVHESVRSLDADREVMAVKWHLSERLARSSCSSRGFPQCCRRSLVSRSDRATESECDAVASTMCAPFLRPKSESARHIRRYTSDSSPTLSRTGFVTIPGPVGIVKSLFWQGLLQMNFRNGSNARPSS